MHSELFPSIADQHENRSLSCPKGGKGTSLAPIHNDSEMVEICLLPR